MALTPLTPRGANVALLGLGSFADLELSTGVVIVGLSPTPNFGIERRSPGRGGGGGERRGARHLLNPERAREFRVRFFSPRCRLRFLAVRSCDRAGPRLFSLCLFNESQGSDISGGRKKWEKLLPFHTLGQLRYGPSRL